MSGLLDFIGARTPSGAKTVLASILSGPQQRAMKLTENPARFLADALREAIGADAQERAWAYRQNNLDAISGSSETRNSAVMASNEASLNNAMNALGITKGKWRDVFHGTKGNFDPARYDLAKAATASGHQSSQFPVMWTTTSPQVSNMFIAGNVKDVHPIKKYGQQGAGVNSIQTSKYIEEGNIQPLKVKLNNPLVIKGSDAERMILGGRADDWRDSGAEFQKVLLEAKNAGYDGVIIKANPRGSLEFRAEQYLSFDPKTQIKSRFDK